MKIYRVYRTDEVGYDEYDSHIVIAENPKDARHMCKWGDALNPKVRVQEIKIGKKPKNLLGSFNAG
jgi:hypothetical protein